MFKHRLGALTIAVVVALVGCSDQTTAPYSPDAQAPAEARAALVQSLEASGYTDICHTIGFEEFDHGDKVDEIDLTAVAGFGFMLTVETIEDTPPWLDPSNQARAFDTEAGVEYDEDLQAPPYGFCDDCAGQGMILVIEDFRGFFEQGDSGEGGSITFSGFADFEGEGHFFVDEFKAIDVHEPEGPLELHLDGEWVAESNVPAEEATVQTIQVEDDGSPVFFSETMAFIFDGSGAIDDIELCIRVPDTPGDEGCTPGYWRTHSIYAPGNQADAWPPTGWHADQLVTEMFSEAGAYPVGDMTLHEALHGGGGPGADGGARILARAAVAAVLNASHPDVNYPHSVGSIVDAVNEALASGDRRAMTSLAGELDEDNNLGCSL